MPYLIDLNNKEICPNYFEEVKRLESFKNYQCADKDLVFDENLKGEFARAGLYWTKKNQEIRCIFCHFRLISLGAGDTDPVGLHYRFNCACSFYSHTENRNVPIDGELVQKCLQRVPYFRLYQSFDKRIQTFKSLIEIKTISKDLAEELCDAGYFSNGTNKIKCFCCRVEADINEEVWKIHNKHGEKNKYCLFHVKFCSRPSWERQNYSKSKQSITSVFARKNTISNKKNNLEHGSHDRPLNKSDTRPNVINKVWQCANLLSPSVEKLSSPDYFHQFKPEIIEEIPIQNDKKLEKSGETSFSLPKTFDFQVPERNPNPTIHSGSLAQAQIVSLGSPKPFAQLNEPDKLNSTDECVGQISSSEISVSSDNQNNTNSTRNPVSPQQVEWDSQDDIVLSKIDRLTVGARGNQLSTKSVTQLVEDIHVGPSRKNTKSSQGNDMRNMKGNTNISQKYTLDEIQPTRIKTPQILIKIQNQEDNKNKQDHSLLVLTIPKDESYKSVPNAINSQNHEEVTKRYSDDEGNGQMTVESVSSEIQITPHSDTQAQLVSSGSRPDKHNVNGIVECVTTSPASFQQCESDSQGDSVWSQNPAVEKISMKKEEQKDGPKSYTDTDGNHNDYSAEIDRLNVNVTCGDQISSNNDGLQSSQFDFQDPEKNINRSINTDSHGQFVSHDSQKQLVSASATGDDQLPIQNAATRSDTSSDKPNNSIELERNLSVRQGIAHFQKLNKIVPNLQGSHINNPNKTFSSYPSYKQVSKAAYPQEENDEMSSGSVSSDFQIPLQKKFGTTKNLDSDVDISIHSDTQPLLVLPNDSNTLKNEEISSVSSIRIQKSPDKQGNKRSLSRSSPIHQASRRKQFQKNNNKRYLRDSRINNQNKIIAPDESHEQTSKPINFQEHEDVTKRRSGCEENDQLLSSVSVSSDIHATPQENSEESGTKKKPNTDNGFLIPSDAQGQAHLASLGSGKSISQLKEADKDAISSSASFNNTTKTETSLASLQQFESNSQDDSVLNQNPTVEKISMKKEEQNEGPKSYTDADGNRNETDYSAEIDRLFSVTCGDQIASNNDGLQSSQSDFQDPEKNINRLINTDSHGQFVSYDSQKQCSQYSGLNEPCDALLNASATGDDQLPIQNAATRSNTFSDKPNNSIELEGNLSVSQGIAHFQKLNKNVPNLKGSTTEIVCGTNPPNDLVLYPKEKESLPNRTPNVLRSKSLDQQTKPKIAPRPNNFKKINLNK